MIMRKIAIITLLLVLLALAGTAFSLDRIGIVDLNVKVDGRNTKSIMVPLEDTDPPTLVTFDVSAQNFSFSAAATASGTIELLDSTTYEPIVGASVPVTFAIGPGGGTIAVTDIGPMDLSPDFRQGTTIVRVSLNPATAGEYMGNNVYEESITVFKEQAPLPIDELRIEIVVLLGLFVVGFIGSQKK